MTITNFKPQLNEAPANVDFAILDLAQKDEGELLKWLYRHFEQREIPWASLYQDTELANNWATGPILVELRGAPVFEKALIERYQNEPLGLLISAPDAHLAEMADHLRQQVIVQKDAQPTVFRFYDPRALGPLFEALEPIQRQQLIGPGEGWSWYHQGQWWQIGPLPSSTQPNEGGALLITAEQLARMDEARLGQFASFLARTYRVHIPADDVEAFALNEVQAAKAAGLSVQADLDRWLRMAIKVQAPLQESSQWRAIAKDAERTPLQILSQLECEQGR